MDVKRRGLHKVHGNNNNYVLEIKKSFGGGSPWRTFLPTSKTSNPAHANSFENQESQEY